MRRMFSGHDLLMIMEQAQVGVGSTKMIVDELERRRAQPNTTVRAFTYPPGKEHPMQSASKALTRAILENPKDHDWTIQGLGMLRTYLDPEHIYRLHVWSTAHMNPGVSTLHTHPWDFESLVVAGEVMNVRYIELTRAQIEEAHTTPNVATWQRQTIRCGEGGGLVGGPEDVFLQRQAGEKYIAGDSYDQKAAEVHESSPKHGSVTIIKRTFGSDTEHAYVYFPVGDEWVTAEPRPAEPDEVACICADALELWFS